jgi:DNA-binding NarL/FixJ family response regulator
MSIRLTIADADPSMLVRLAKLCSRQRDFETIARVSSGRQALWALARYHPDILLLDIRIGSPSALAVLARMQREHSLTRTVVLLEPENDGVDALALGASGVIFKAVVPKLLAECIREVHAGKKWFEPDHSVSILEKLVTQPTSTRQISELLTPREVEVARMVGKGLDARALAKELAITVGTAKVHLQRVYWKLNVASRVDLMKLVQAKGLK